MVSWETFAAESPELAWLGLERLNRRICYLATIKKDGSPRLHPVTPFIGEGMLFIFTEPSSPKIGDLCRDGRYALHCAVGGEGPLVEFLVSGTARVVTDPQVRLQAERIAASPVVTDGYYLFEFLVKRALAVTYDPAGKPLPRRWHASK